jgi:soluble lytic murein transglycosylase
VQETPGAKSALLRRLLVVIALLLTAGAALAYFHLTMPGWYARWWYPLEYQDLITRNSDQFNLDPALVAAVIYEESSFGDGSTSRSGAQGLMQLMPATARWIAVQMDGNEPTLEQIQDPAQNIQYGSWYLRYLLDRYGGSEMLALAAYNAGTDNVDQWIAAAQKDGREFDSLVDIPYQETRDYVYDVDKTRDIYRKAYPDELSSLTSSRNNPSS